MTGRNRSPFPLIGITIVLALIFILPAVAQDEEYEPIGSSDCAGCHEESSHGTLIEADIAHSIHEGVECMDCHLNKGTLPHKEDDGFSVGCQGCRTCHEDASEQYTAHGRGEAQSCGDIPSCSSCHGTDVRWSPAPERYGA